MQKAEPISAHPDKLREQIEENSIMLEDLEKRKDAVEHVKAAAEELIAKGRCTKDTRSLGQISVPRTFMDGSSN